MEKASPGRDESFRSKFRGIFIKKQGVAEPPESLFKQQRSAPMKERPDRLNKTVEWHQGKPVSSSLKHHTLNVKLKPKQTVPITRNFPRRSLMKSQDFDLKFGRSLNTFKSPVRIFKENDLKRPLPIADEETFVKRPVVGAAPFTDSSSQLQVSEIPKVEDSMIDELVVSNIVFQRRPLAPQSTPERLSHGSHKRTPTHEGTDFSSGTFKSSLHPSTKFDFRSHPKNKRINEKIEVI